MLNKKGFTLVELLAMMVILGILMAVTIPNIAGIAEANKKQAYAEDALKFKNTVEYLLRSGDEENYLKPEHDGECVVVSLTHLVADEYGNVDLAGTEYENAPNGGKYWVDYSYVVMKKKSGEYEYHVQLIEDLDGSGSGVATMGIQLTNYQGLQNSGYLDKVEDFTSAPGTALNSYSAARSALGSLCPGNVRGIYYSNSFLDA